MRNLFGWAIIALMKKDLKLTFLDLSFDRYLIWLWIYVFLDPTTYLISLSSTYYYIPTICTCEFKLVDKITHHYKKSGLNYISGPCWFCTPWLVWPRFAKKYIIMQYFTIQLKVNSRYCYVMLKIVGFKWQKIFSPMIRSSHQMAI